MATPKRGTKAYSKYDEECEQRLRAQITFAQANLSVHEAAKAAGESVTHFLSTRRKPLFKIMSEFEKTQRCLVRDHFETISDVHGYDEFELTRWERQPLNFDPRYVLGWCEYECRVANGVALRVGFGIAPDQKDDVPRFSVELLCDPNALVFRHDYPKLLADIPKHDPQKYTHHQVTTAVHKRLVQLEAVFEEPTQQKPRGRMPKR